MGVVLSDRRSPQAAEKIAELQRRVQQMQGVPAGHELDQDPELSGLPRLRTGSVYQVDSPALALAMLSGPSQAGEWIGIVGIPELGYESAAELGVDLARVIVVPDPGAHWLSVLAGLAEITSVVLVRPPGPVSAGQAEKLRSRLRLKGTALLSWGTWPRAEATVSLRSSRWVGLGHGHGHLTSRLAQVDVAWSGRRLHSVQLWLPGDDARVSEVQPDHDQRADQTPVELLARSVAG